MFRPQHILTNETLFYFLIFLKSTLNAGFRCMLAFGNFVGIAEFTLEFLTQ